MDTLSILFSLRFLATLFHQVFGVEPNLVTIKNGITYAETTICTSKATKIVETIMPIDNERQRGCITFQVSEISEPESYEQLKEWVDEAIKSLKEAKWYLGSWKDTLFLEVKHFTIKMVFYTEPWY